jgi:hypothetical protein
VVIEEIEFWGVTVVYCYVCCVCSWKIFVAIQGMGVLSLTGVYFYVCCVCRGNCLWLYRE